MRTITVTMLGLGLLLGAAAPAQATIVLHRSMHGVSLGQSEAAVRKRLIVRPQGRECGTLLNLVPGAGPRPSHRECAVHFPRNDIVDFRQTSLTVVFSKNRAIRLTTDAPSEKTAKGIGVFSTNSAVARAYPVCRSLDFVCVLGRTAKVGDRYTLFEHSGTTKLTSITIARVMSTSRYQYLSPDR